AALVTLALWSFGPEIAAAAGRPLGHAWSRFGPVALAAAAAVLLLVLSGAYTAARPAVECGGWPLCDGRVLPAGFDPTDIQLIHRWIALVASLAVLAAAVQARRLRADAPVLVATATAAAVLTAAQILVGAASVWFRLNPALLVAHLAVAIVVLMLLVAAVALDRLLPLAPVARPERRSWRLIGADYVTLTKPGVMVLLLITTLGAMLIAQGGLPPLRILFWTLIGGALSSGGAAAWNHYLDRDIDVIMKRTRSRPLPGKRIPDIHVPLFALTLTVLSVYLLAVFVNPLAALLSLAGNLFYVLIYTRVLKRSTPQNIVIGGAAGAVPPLVGWAAVTGQVGLPALLLFGVVFYWTPPHFWSLALFTSSDYAAASVPMFPEVYGDEETRRHIFLYTVMLVITSLFFFAIRVMGLFYLASALILGGLFLYKAFQLTRHPADQKLLARALFFYSMWYLGLIFAAMVIDRVLLG
ncbi:MAG TPA: heme o synthase, partial [Nitrolancea sp.]|nr:heme o synthase [Nitrolancea sp.]